jgi:folylpolyglutamate synthase
MLEWLAKAGYSPKDFDPLNPIHIAGTKGKGSTSAFVSSILHQYTASGVENAPKNIGLFTSPHIRFVRERIQVNNEPISESLFTSFFFDIWNRLSVAADGSKPMYFRFLTIVALHAFLRMKVDTAVIECGIGGEFDSTNILNKPKVTAITALGIDHEALLGSTISSIAWHKAGIFKQGATALTVSQRRDAMQVLRERAQEKGVELRIVGLHPEIESGDVELGLKADYQMSNASLAAAIASTQLRQLGCPGVPDLIENPRASLPEEFKRGLKMVRWPGRSDIRRDTQSDTTWYLDGAHTMESIELSSRWFADEVKKSLYPKRRVLIFNQQTRDAVGLSRALYQTLRPVLGDSPFQCAIFTTNVMSKAAGIRHDLVSINNESDTELKVQHGLAKAWKALDPNSEVVVSPTVDTAIQMAREASGGGNMVLIIGSLHLVGGAIDVLESPVK